MGRALLGTVWPFLDPLDVVGLRTKAVEFRPFVPAETLTARALIGLHLMATESASVSSGSQSTDLGDAWRYGCLKSFDTDSEVESGTESEGTSSSEQCAHNVDSHALNVIGQNWSGEKVSLLWRSARKCVKSGGWMAAA